MPRTRPLVLAVLICVAVVGLQISRNIRWAPAALNQPTRRQPPLNLGAGNANPLTPAQQQAGESEEGDNPVTNEGQSETRDDASSSQSADSSKKPPPKRIGGRDGKDDSHNGLIANHEGIHFAWGVNDSRRCHGTYLRDDCIDQKNVEWFKKNVLFGIVSGKEGAFRVEVSQCTWLGHFPPENVFVFSDIVAKHPPQTAHHWVEGVLPDGVYEKDGDVFSNFIKKGYVREVRRAGQGYSAGWIVAQFRFPQALRVLLDEAAKRKTIKWIMIGDDDTVVNLNNLVKRLKPMDTRKKWYLSRRGWGGAGHIYSLGAMEATRAVLDECIERWMVKQFRASDTMLLKCATHAKLEKQLEHTMSHCPASRAGVEKMLSDVQVTFHGKKDFYPPVVSATFRVGLYYLASYCRDKKAASLAVQYSSCAFGNCKIPSCSKAHDSARNATWHKFSKGNSIDTVPFDDLSGVPPVKG